jgi:hypothetical protein
MRAFITAIMPYTRKAKAAFIGFVLSGLIAFMQDPGVLGWVGTLPRPWNTIALAGIPVALMWAVRERGNYGGFDDAEGNA